MRSKPEIMYFKSLALLLAVVAFCMPLSLCAQDHGEEEKLVPKRIVVMDKDAPFELSEPTEHQQRSVVDPIMIPFYHGVASGDPTAGAVMLWTKVTDASNPASIDVAWEVATDVDFCNIVQQGVEQTDISRAYTVKIDVAGLMPDAVYYYRFYALGKYSIIGRTKTAPVGAVANARFAIVSCAEYENGYYNAYKEIANRNDLSAVIHLGDYIYEYGNGGLAGTVRTADPSTEIISLSDYRTRHSHYKLDQDLRRMHQVYPMMSVWDDHEVANDGWYGGAQNHDGGEGNWFDRKSVAIQAYNEWMPLRQPDPSDDERIYRSFNYGDLADIIMLDTRYEDRDEQPSSIFDSDYDDPNYSILGTDQYNWLIGQLGASSAKWKVLGQQVMMAPLEIFGQPFNLDQWDGYPAERENLFNYVSSNNIDNLVVLTGDIHTAWANDLPMSGYDDNTGANSAGVEFVTSSVTSPNFPFPIGENLIQLANDHMKYVDLTSHGYMVMDLDHNRAHTEYYSLSTISDNSGTAIYENSLKANDGDNHLTGASGPLPLNPIGIAPPLAPPASTVVANIKVMLEGPFIAGTGLMSTQLSAANRMPLSQPFAAAPWSYGGTESFSSAATIPSTAVDWVLVELWDGATVMDAAAGILLNDGKIIDAGTGGSTCGLSFSNIAPGRSYTIVVRTRNHVATASAAPVTLPLLNGQYYDFSTSLSQAMATGIVPMVQLSNGAWAQFAGDCNASGIITVDDFDLYKKDALLAVPGYYPGDLNYDGNVNYDDYQIYLPNASVIGEEMIWY